MDEWMERPKLFFIGLGVGTQRVVYTEEYIGFVDARELVHLKDGRGL